MGNFPTADVEKVTFEERSPKENARKTVIINPTIAVDGNASINTQGVTVINTVSLYHMYNVFQNSQIIIDREAGEIIRLAASVHLSVHPWTLYLL